MAEYCAICHKEMDTGQLADTNCGGDCMQCMAEIAEDPDCIAALTNAVTEVTKTPTVR